MKWLNCSSNKCSLAIFPFLGPTLWLFVASGNYDQLSSRVLRSQVSPLSRSWAHSGIPVPMYTYRQWAWSLHRGGSDMPEFPYPHYRRVDVTWLPVPFFWVTWSQNKTFWSTDPWHFRKHSLSGNRMAALVPTSANMAALPRYE